MQVSYHCRLTVETCAEGQTRALAPSWARWLIGRLSVVRILIRTRKTRSIFGRRQSSATGAGETPSEGGRAGIGVANGQDARSLVEARWGHGVVVGDAESGVGAPNGTVAQRRD